MTFIRYQVQDTKIYDTKVSQIKNQQNNKIHQKKKNHKIIGYIRQFACMLNYFK